MEIKLGLNEILRGLADAPAKKLFIGFVAIVTWQAASDIARDFTASDALDKILAPHWPETPVAGLVVTASIYYAIRSLIRYFRFITVTKLRKQRAKRRAAIEANKLEETQLIDEIAQLKKQREQLDNLEHLATWLERRKRLRDLLSDGIKLIEIATRRIA
jgi:hypothetical protein